MRLSLQVTETGVGREGMANEQGTIQRVLSQQAEHLALVMGRGEVGGSVSPGKGEA